MSETLARGAATRSPTEDDRRQLRLPAPGIAAHRATGTVVRTAGDTMHVEEDGTRMPWRVDAARVSGLSVSLGQTPHVELVRRGLVVGAARMRDGRRAVAVRLAFR